ncbi:MAG: preprotein translocase subunit YajC [Eubacterium sp.]|nr:preprotein translocase subunit YajC [Eubacterium sp.]
MNSSDIMQVMPSILMLVVFMGLMYFLLIRPQRKKEKEISEMRASLGVGDEIVTIGGIIGKVVKVGEEELVIQVGSDKTKILVKKWSVSAIERKSGAKMIKKAPAQEEQQPEEEEKKKTPKRLKKDKKDKEEKAEDAE